MGLGHFSVFMSDLSLHHVSPVAGSRKPMIALFCYDRNLGIVFDQSYIDDLHDSMAH